MQHELTGGCKQSAGKVQFTAAITEALKPYSVTKHPQHSTLDCHASSLLNSIPHLLLLLY
jgi:hypothetical protein